MTCAYDSDITAGPLEGGMCLDRALRLLASAALLCYGIYIACFVALHEAGFAAW